MKLSTLMTISAVVAFIFGLGFIVAPAATISMYGNTLNNPGEFVGRFLGAAFIGYAFILWLNRKALASPTRNGMVAGFFVAMVLGFVVAIYEIFAGTGNALHWLNVIIYLLLAIGFGYFAFTQKD